MATTTRHNHSVDSAELKNPQGQGSNLFNNTTTIGSQDDINSNSCIPPKNYEIQRGNPWFVDHEEQQAEHKEE